MKVLAFCNDFCPLTHTFIYNEIIGVAETLDTTVLCTNLINQDKFPFSKIKEIKKPKTGIFDFIRWQFQKRNLAFHLSNKIYSKNLTQFVENFNPDIIHLHFGTDAILFLDNYKIKDSDRVFISYHGYDASRMLEQNKYYRKRIIEIHKKKNIFPIVISNDMYNRMKNHNIPFLKKRILYYGANLSHFKRVNYNNSNKETKRFLQISHFKEKKGLEYTLRAFKLFQQKHPTKKAELVLAGNGPLLDAMKQLVQKLSLTDKVSFPGYVTVDQSKELLEGADFFVHHSITAVNGDKEGIPNAIIEAMAMELPVLSTVHSGIPELIEDGKNGFLSMEKDVEHYSKSMNDIYSWSYQPDNRQKVMEHFNLESHNDKLIKFYQEVLH
jgi:glycosyltransferase involved in cell wall biosynthesis